MNPSKDGAGPWGGTADRGYQPQAWGARVGVSRTRAAPPSGLLHGAGSAVGARDAPCESRCVPLAAFVPGSLIGWGAPGGHWGFSAVCPEPTICSTHWDSVFLPQSSRNIIFTVFLWDLCKVTAGVKAHVNVNCSHQLSLRLNELPRWACFLSGTVTIRRAVLIYWLAWVLHEGYI